MANSWKSQIDAFVKSWAEKKQKSKDMDVLISAMLELPPGQVKKLLTDAEVLEVLRKYGVEV